MFCHIKQGGGIPLHISLQNWVLHDHNRIWVEAVVAKA
jgi:hypothetical protein